MHLKAAIQKILEQDQRFDFDAYVFLQETLNFTVNQERQKERGTQHISGKQLLEGWKDYALERYGPMATTLFSEWGVQTCGDVGDMVFLLIEAGVLGKQASDKREDFTEIYTFKEVFEQPFLPNKA